MIEQNEQNELEKLAMVQLNNKKKKKLMKKLKKKMTEDKLEELNRLLKEPQVNEHSITQQSVEKTLIEYTTYYTPITVKENQE
mmetsp:Transcript_44871/g.43455  ORF Transcript_44871/g.43455 Transcript_44871/m.43455 type:complete len:83 (+) Transcript_44871:73-321(+)